MNTRESWPSGSFAGSTRYSSFASRTLAKKVLNRSSGFVPGGVGWSWYSYFLPVPSVPESVSSYSFLVVTLMPTLFSGPSGPK